MPCLNKLCGSTSMPVQGMLVNTNLPHVCAELNVVTVQDVNVVNTQALQAGPDAGYHTLRAVVRLLACTANQGSMWSSARIS